MSLHAIHLKAEPSAMTAAQQSTVALAGRVITALLENTWTVEEI